MPLPSSVLTRAGIRAPKGIVYGPPGVGKTTFGSTAVKAIIVDCENGASHVSCDRTPYLYDWPSIQQWLEALASGDHEYETVVVDSLDWLLRRAEEHVSGVNYTLAGLKQTLNRSHGGYGNGKQVLRNYVYQYLLPIFDTLVNSGIAVLLLAHTARHEITTIDGVTMEKSGPEIHPDLANTMIEWSDFVGAARIGTAGRELILSETGQLLAKNRYKITTPLSLSWQALLDAMTNPNNKENKNA
ncbi:MAG: ATP-binding protein [Planctomycetes bacterium]|nr:ATP-binding protein [Planctomycetota bacterium]